MKLTTIVSLYKNKVRNMNQLEPQNVAVSKYGENKIGTYHYGTMH